MLIGFSSILLMMFVILILLNHLFVDDFFFYINQKNMRQNANRIVDNSEFKDYNMLTRELLKRTGGECVIVDEHENIIFGPKHYPKAKLIPSDEIKRMITYASSNKQEGSIQIVGSGNYLDQHILFVKALKDGNYVVLNKGLGIVNEARRIFIYFLALASIIVYVFGFMLIYLYAVRFTRPIINLKMVAERIASLDFAGHMEASSSDEIGELITSVNKMAMELSVNINALNESNILLEKELSKERDMEKMRRRFVSDVSHELKNPISMIIGYADGIERGLPKTDEDKAYYAHVILEEGKKMNRLVKDLLDLSSYTSGVMAMYMEDVDLTALVNASLERFQQISDEKSIRLDLNMKSELKVKGDRLRLEQVLINLLDNAFKHVEQRGKIAVLLNENNEGTQLVISNTGNLIPVEELDRIWESFYQVDTDTDGNGLGLAIVKSIVELHGGRVSVNVDEGMNHFQVVI